MTIKALYTSLCFIKSFVLGDECQMDWVREEGDRRSDECLTEWEKRVSERGWSVKRMIGEVVNVWQSKRRGWVSEGDRRRGWSTKWSMWWRNGRRGWVRDVLKCERERVRLVWSVWQRRWVREWGVWGVNFKMYLFETESLRLGFQIWNRVSKTRFPRVQPRHRQMPTWTPRKNRVLETRFPRGVHVDLLPCQV